MLAINTLTRVIMSGIPSASRLRVAIVGGGISGLAAAYYLMRRARATGAAVDLHLYESKRMLGGNAETVVVDLGRIRQGGQPGAAYLRWADLGVNDANLATYVLMKDVMTDIGYLPNMRPLQDTDCFHDARLGTAMTDDANLADGVSDPRLDLAAADGGLLAPLIQVVHRTALDMVDGVPLDYTCAAFFQDCLDDPQAMLTEAAAGLGIAIDWNDSKLPARLEQVRDAYYYSRISAMYFTDPRGPACMPLAAPFQYYRLQEGGGTPQRCYFDHGAQTWIEALANHLLAQSDERISLALHTGEEAKVRVGGGMLAIAGADGAAAFDVCVMANHADDAARALHFDDAASAAYGDKLLATLCGIRYTTGYAVCHTAAARMPANRNAWRTYNIPVRSPNDSVLPYRIDYVVNLHQNDPCNPAYDRAGLPVYFVSLVDDLNAIPRDEMLDRVADPAAVPDAWRARLPASTLARMEAPHAGASGYAHQRHARQPLHPALDTKAWTVFKHNVLDAGCLQAQADIKAWNLAAAGQRLGIAPAGDTAGAGPLPALLFGGGWTRGAGLQEQCLEQGRQLAAWLLPD
jgi:hypothetical protein